MKNKDILTLRNWEILGVPGEEFTSPELATLLLGGNVYNHPRFEDGKYIQTSYIVDSDKENGTIATCSGSVYFIEKDDVSKEYEEAFPDAYERAFKIGDFCD